MGRVFLRLAVAALVAPIEAGARLRASAIGAVRILVPMPAHVHQIKQALALIARAKEQLKDAHREFDARACW